MGVSAHIGIFFIHQQRLTFGDTFSEIFELAILFCNGRDFAVCLRSLLVFRRIGDDFGRSERSRQLVVPGFDSIKSFKHSRQWPGASGQPLS